MAYTKLDWQDYPNKTTPVDAANLNRMEDGITEAKEGVTQAFAEISNVAARIDSQIDSKIPANVTAWLNSHVNPTGSTVALDDTLSVRGAAADAQAVGTLALHFVRTVDYNNYQSFLPTLAGAGLNTIYVITMNGSGHQSDYPTDFGYGTNLLITIGSAAYKEQYIVRDTLIGMNATIIHRRYYSGSYHNWELGLGQQKLIRYVRNLNYMNYQDILPTLAAAPFNTIHVITMSPDAHQPDYPTDLNNYGTLTLITFGEDSYREQIIIGEDNYAKRRWYNGVWNEWRYGVPRRKQIKIGPGHEFTSLVEGLTTAYTYRNCDVIINPGTYDIVYEYREIHGPNYFSDASFDDNGLLIGHGCKYYFEPGSQVNCILPSNASTKAQNQFSAFMAGDGDYELIGLRVYSEYCRYSVHDEMNGVGKYHHVYKDCYMHHNDTGAGYIQCIGGGLGANGLIDIDGCVFESDTAETNDEGIVSWHNGYYGNIQSFINIRNCYFKNGHVRFSWYGSSELISEMNISGCSFKSSVVDERAETSDSNIRNTSVKQWCNEIRNQ